jgi:hypothetical protein
MATTWKATAVRIERPAEASPADFLASVRSWLNHHCIIADLSVKAHACDAAFDNPRDARLFERRFAVRPTKDIANRNANRWPSKAISAVAAPIESGLVPVGDAA